LPISSKKTIDKALGQSVLGIWQCPNPTRLVIPEQATKFNRIESQENTAAFEGEADSARLPILVVTPENVEPIGTVFVADPRSDLGRKSI
jgi:hypothetical protein